MATRAAMVGSLIGGGLMYFFDPLAGRRRRALMADQLASLGRQAGETRTTTLRDMRNRLHGLRSEAAAALRGGEIVPDTVVEERARAALGPLLRYPRLVEVRAADGRVALSGAVPADEVQRLLRRVRAVRGVQSLDNRLDVHDDPATLPGIEGTVIPRRPAPAIALFRRRWPPAIRLLAAVAGAGLLWNGARRAGVRGLGFMLLGAGALARSLSNEPLTGTPPGPRRTRTPEELAHARAGGSWTAD